MSAGKMNLAIFDLDGTLFDTGEVNYFAYRDALLPFGIKLEHDYYIQKCNGRHYTEFLPVIMDCEENIEEVHRAKKYAYSKNLYRARKNIHLFEIIKCLKETYYTAIVTTASRRNTEDVLNYFKCSELFDYVISQENITKVKPDPQGFLMVMDYFDISPEHTVIFEDSDVGIKAARATGAAVIIVDKF